MKSRVSAHRSGWLVGLAALLALGNAGCRLLVDAEEWSAVTLPNGEQGGAGGGGEGGASDGGAGGGGGMGGGEFEQPTCADGITNALETDVDCGGDSCLPCVEGCACDWDNDCESANCAAGECGPPLPPECSVPDPENPHCNDCETNGLETDVDCGGDSCPPCADGEQCVTSADCKSTLCDGGQCVPPGIVACGPVDPDNPDCGDCTKNGLETDVDCGGDSCHPCALGQTCAVDADCATLACDQGACVPSVPACNPLDPTNPNCGDCTKNGLETDVDCGGDACGPCDPGKACDNDADCAALVCDSGTCL